MADAEVAKLVFHAVKECAKPAAKTIATAVKETAKLAAMAARSK